MVKITRKLSQELHQPRRQGAMAPAIPCALKQKLSCCDGVGFRLNTSGAYAQADLCDCVKSCSTCFGQARQVKNGEAVNCREPSPVKIANLLNGASIPSRYGTARLDQFANFTGNGREIVNLARNWLQEFKPRVSRGLILGGPVGVGKTYLLCAMAKGLAAKGVTVRFIDFFQLLSELKAAYASNKADDSVLQPLIHVDVLIIDELGKGRNTDWEISILDQLVMGRYNQNKTIIASTNYDLKPDQRKRYSFNMPLDDNDGGSGFQLNQFESLESRVGSRIYSRLGELCRFIEITGEDFRKQFVASSAPFFAKNDRGLPR